MTQKQTKNKSQKFNVQLSKDDLKELLGVVKDFVYESVLVELHRQSRRIFLNTSENAKEIAGIKAREEKNAVTISDNILEHSQRIIKLEKVEYNHRKEIHKLKQHCAHDTQFDSIGCFTSRNDGRTNFLTLIYKCPQCGLKFEKHSWQLSRKEKKAIRILGVKI